MEKKGSALQRTNLLVLLINMALDLFLIIGYVAEYFKGGRSRQFVIIFIVLVLLPIIFATLMYARDKDNKHIKLITIIGFFIIYIFAMFTSPRVMIYTYVFTIATIYILYFNLPFMVAISSITFVINAVRIAYSYSFLGIKGTSLTTDYTIQFSSILLYCFCLIIATVLSNRFSFEKLNEISEEKAKQEEILQGVLKTAAILDKNSSSVYEIVKNLAVSTETITSAVSQIAAGALNTASNMQVQVQMTEEIQGLINDASISSQNANSISSDTVKAVEDGLKIVEDLNSKAAIVCGQNENVLNTMIELKEKSNDIHNIIGIISSISEQTNMLSLNASIESARAGEAGKGFAVVANEIRRLAGQSKDSANEIAQIINNLTNKAESSMDEVTQLGQVNNEQNELIMKTKDVFDNITTRINALNTDVDYVKEKIDEILKSNKAIVESISEISAVSEQTTANTQEASAVAEQNIGQANAAEKLVEELIETSNAIRVYL